MSSFLLFFAGVAVGIIAGYLLALYVVARLNMPRLVESVRQDFRDGKHGTPKFEPRPLESDLREDR